MCVITLDLQILQWLFFSSLCIRVFRFQSFTRSYDFGAVCTNVWTYLLTYLCTVVCRDCRRSWVTTTPRRWVTWYEGSSTSTTQSSTTYQLTLGTSSASCFSLTNGFSALRSVFRLGPFSSRRYINCKLSLLRGCWWQHNGNNGKHLAINSSCSDVVQVYESKHNTYVNIQLRMLTYVLCLLS